MVSVLREGYRIPFRDLLPPPPPPRQVAGIVPNVPARLSAGSRPPSGSREHDNEGSPGDRTRSGSRLLQPPLSSRKGIRRLETRDRPLPSQRIRTTNPLNEFVRQTPFKMETTASVLLSVRKGDFLASVDQKDTYFQIPIHHSSRRLLRFVTDGTVHQLKVLCFGLSTTPQVFMRVFATVSAWAHSRRVRLLRYLDDWLVLASETRAKQHVRELLSLCHSLGIVINEEKSDLNPSQSVEYLGMSIGTVVARAFSTVASVERFLSIARRFLSCQNPPAQL